MPSVFVVPGLQPAHLEQNPAAPWGGAPPLWPEMIQSNLCTNASGLSDRRSFLGHLLAADSFMIHSCKYMNAQHIFLDSSGRWLSSDTAKLEKKGGI